MNTYARTKGAASLGSHIIGKIRSPLNVGGRLGWRPRHSAGATRVPALAQPGCRWRPAMETALRDVARQLVLQHHLKVIAVAKELCERGSLDSAEVRAAMAATSLALLVVTPFRQARLKTSWRFTP
jgi:hypothetical protein